MVVRTTELKKLESLYSLDQNNIVFVYGRKDCDKEALFDRFTTGKNYFYYRARQCSLNKQLQLLKDQMALTYGITTECKSFDDCFFNFKSSGQDKLVFILDEAQYAIKKDLSLLESLASLYKGKLCSKKVMIIVAASSIVWAENSFIELCKAASFKFEETIKLENLSFLDVVRAFPEYSVAQCVSTYGIVGGVAGFLNRWDGKKSIKDNVCNYILSPTGFLFTKAEDYISSELRELSCYDTILSSIASGHEKLNDLYEDTGYSRAKISVYIKNLAAFDVVEKAQSFETGGWDNTKKGVYRIKDAFTNFWFTFIYPHMSELFSYTPEHFYDTFIEPGLNDYLQLYFVNVCREYLHLLNTVDQLPIKLIKIGTWIGKEGTIDVVGQNSIRENVVGICNWSKDSMSYDSYENLLTLMKQARISAVSIYLFSATKFDESLMKLAAENKSVVLVDMTEL